MGLGDSSGVFRGKPMGFQISGVIWGRGRGGHAHIRSSRFAVVLFQTNSDAVGAIYFQSLFDLWRFHGFPSFFPGEWFSCRSDEPAPLQAFFEGTPFCWLRRTTRRTSILRWVPCKRPPPKTLLAPHSSCSKADCHNIEKHHPPFPRGEPTA